jgi:hypothetical protein
MNKAILQVPRQITLALKTVLTNAGLNSYINGDNAEITTPAVLCMCNEMEWHKDQAIALRDGFEWNAVSTEIKFLVIASRYDNQSVDDYAQTILELFLNHGAGSNALAEALPEYEFTQLQPNFYRQGHSEETSCDEVELSYLLQLRIRPSEYENIDTETP